MSRRADAACAAALLALGVLCAALAWLPVRGGRAEIQDEHVYLFQAKTLLSGRLSAPTPPLPEHFEAAHVLVTPRWSARYFPGQALLLAPFLALGAPWLLACLTLGGSAALIFLLLRRAGCGRAASIIASALLLLSPEPLRLWASFLSQPTSAFLMLLAALCAARFREAASPLRAAALSLCIGFAFLVRPYTGVALAVASLPILLQTRPARAAVAAGLAPLALALLFALFFCHAITGSFTTSPWALYAAQYMPFDGPGLGAPSTTAPLRALPLHLAQLSEGFALSRARYTAAALPGVAWQRLCAAIELLPSKLLLAPALLGLLSARALLFPLVFAAAWFALGLTFHSSLDLYLVELVPVLALLAGLGLDRLIRFGLSLRSRFAKLALIASAALAALWVSLSAVPELRALALRDPGSIRLARRAELALEPARRERGLVFLRSADGSGLSELLQNEPDLKGATLVLALDRGARNVELEKTFPERPAYLLDVQSMELRRLER
jgi:hypothetical protein